MSVLAEEKEAALVRGEPIDLAEFAMISSTLVRLASRIGLSRRPKVVVPTLDVYLDRFAEIEQPESKPPEGEAVSAGAIIPH
jgi:hypothetical protein